MIKRIPIKGISRDPSGQIAADGMCADSLNVQLDMGELAPAIAPKEANARFERAVGGTVAANDQITGEPRYIHKGDGYENLLCVITSQEEVENENVTVYTVKSFSKVHGGQMVYTSTGAEVADIIAVGNTLVVSAGEKIVYILWKNGEYRVLGDKVPVPDISFRIGDMVDTRMSEDPLTYEEAGQQGWIEPVEAELIKLDAENYPKFNHDYQGETTEFGSIAKRYSFKDDQYSEFWLPVFDDLWSEVFKAMATERDAGRAIFPIFVRYAVRLYDGSLYSQSIPILLGGDIEYFFSTMGLLVSTTAGASDNISFKEKMIVKCANAYHVFLKSALSNAGIFDGWDDIVTSVDIFISPQILPPQRDAGKFDVKFLMESSTMTFTSRYYSIESFHVDPYYVENNQDEMLMLNQTTYLAKSYTIKEFNELAGVETRMDDLNLSADWIASQESMVETPGSMHRIIGGDFFKYNNRLLIAGAEQKLYPGYEHYHSSEWMLSFPALDFTVYFYIHGEDGDYVVSREITHRSEAIVKDSQTLYNEFPGPWIAYPDSRCYKVVFVRTYQSQQGRTYYGIVTHPMKAASEINISYAFIGFGKHIEPADYTTGAILPVVNDVWVHSDSIYAAKVNNPFLFSTTNEYRFLNGTILAVAAATTPLSEGQFGQFPLYVFTDEGVFALSVNERGDFLISNAVSRDVILGKKAFTAIEQGVFFASARGLLLLQGSTVTKVSELMDGPVDEMDSELQELIAETYITSFGIPDSDTFVSYLNGCRMAYDYVAKRIIVYNPDKDYAYVYKIDTQSWHRFCFGKRLVNALNSYPEALVSTSEEGQANQGVYDFSVPAESEGAEALPGVVYTRELILDGVDVYKAISRLKIRGRYADGHVKWQLQGSNDGVSYVNLHSLRGPSWKWYRLAIVTLLGPKERVSYIELDYEPRFTNKIR